MKGRRRFIPPLGPPPRTAREQALKEWSGADPKAFEKTKLTAKPVQAVLDKVLPGLRLDKRRAEAEIVRVWKDLMPPDVAAHAKPAELRKGILFVNVDSNVWLHEIVRFRQKEILERLQHSFGREKIVKLVLRLG